MAAPAWALACLLGLGAQAFAGETCPGGDVACLPDEEQDSAALLQSPAHARVKRIRTNVVHMNWENSTKLPKRAPVPEKKRSPETAHDCEELAQVLGSGGQFVEALEVLRFICSDDARDRLARMENGCLYVPTDRHLLALFSIVDKPNPWHLHDMFEDSFFPLRPGSGAGALGCPTDSPGAVATSLEGTVTTTCSYGHGFQAMGGRCIPAKLVGQTKTTGVRVFSVEGLMGLDQTWAEMVVSGGEAVRQEEYSVDPNARWPWSSWVDNAKTFIGDALDRLGNLWPWTWAAPKPAPAQAQRPSVQMKLRFYVCDSGDGVTNGKVSDGQIHEQMKAIQAAYSGRDTCSGMLSYQPPHADIGFRFTLDGIVRVSDPACASDCVERIPALTSGFARREDGMVKVVLCETQLLGMASFPGQPESVRVLITNPDTLPGGALAKYNLGKTAVHELGHYFGAYHTFQGGCGGAGDGVADTDPEETQNYGCPGWRRRRTCGGDLSDPVHNIMDYTDDQCMCSFTPGQREVMWSKLQRFQPDLLAVPA